MTSNHGQTIRRALGILQLLQDPTPFLQTKDIIARTDLPKTTTLRLIAMLRAEGLLHATAGGYLGPGPTLLILARAAQTYWQVSSATEEVVEGLAKESGETASIFVVNEISRICVCCAESSQPVRYVLSVGDRLELSSGAASFVLLSGKDPAFLIRVIEAASAAYFAEELFAHVDKARANGFAISHGTREPGLSAVAAPVTCDGRVAAALSVSGPSDRFDGPRLARFVEMAMGSAERLSNASTVDQVFRVQVTVDD